MINVLCRQVNDRLASFYEQLGPWRWDKYIVPKRLWPTTKFLRTSRHLKTGPICTETSLTKYQISSILGLLDLEVGVHMLSRKVSDKRQLSRAVWPFNLVPVSNPETSVTKYQLTPRNIPGERRPYTYRTGSLKRRVKYKHSKLQDASPNTRRTQTQSLSFAWGILAFRRIIGH